MRGIGADGSPSTREGDSASASRAKPAEGRNPRPQPAPPSGSRLTDDLLAQLGQVVRRGPVAGGSVYWEAEAAARWASGQLRLSRFTAAMQLGEFYVRGGVALDRCVLFLRQVTPDLARHSGHQHPLWDLLPSESTVPAAMIE